MTNKELEDVVKRECPDMLSHSNFMENVYKYYCMAEAKVLTKSELNHLSDEEYEAWCKIRSVLNTATVEQLIDYLQENFSPDDYLCYMDCVEGYKNDCTYVVKSQIGKRFFYYVKNLKERCNTEDESDCMFPYVDDNDVVII